MPVLRSTVPNPALSRPMFILFPRYLLILLSSSSHPRPAGGRTPAPPPVCSVLAPTRHQHTAGLRRRGCRLRHCPPPLPHANPFLAFPFLASSSSTPGSSALALANGDAAGRLDVVSNGGRDATAGCQQAVATCGTPGDGA
jgi:hypothetical protein